MEENQIYATAEEGNISFRTFYHLFPNTPLHPSITLSVLLRIALLFKKVNLWSTAHFHKSGGKQTRAALLADGHKVLQKMRERRCQPHVTDLTPKSILLINSEGSDHYKQDGLEEFMAKKL